jgi:hypothetical protein
VARAGFRACAEANFRQIPAPANHAHHSAELKCHFLLRTGHCRDFRDIRMISKVRDGETPSPEHARRPFDLSQGSLCATSSARGR